MLYQHAAVTLLVLRFCYIYHVLSHATKVKF